MIRIVFDFVQMKELLNDLSNQMNQLEHLHHNAYSQNDLRLIFVLFILLLTQWIGLNSYLRIHWSLILNLFLDFCLYHLILLQIYDFSQIWIYLSFLLHQMITFFQMLFYIFPNKYLLDPHHDVMESIYYY